MTDFSKTGWLADLLALSVSKMESCATDGHKYQIHGKLNPAKVACSRCLVSWAIGPRTEPVV